MKSINSIKNSKTFKSFKSSNSVYNLEGGPSSALPLRAGTSVESSVHGTKPNNVTIYMHELRERIKLCFGTMNLII